MCGDEKLDPWRRRGDLGSKRWIRSGEAAVQGGMDLCGVQSREGAGCDKNSGGRSRVQVQDGK